MLRLLIETCVHRRVAALFATLIVAAFGLRAYLDTPIEAYPDVTNTQVTVITQLPGNAPEEIERRVTVPLERELNGTPGMTLMRSESLFGLSLITLTFSDDTASFPARTVVLQRAAAADLPQGVTPEIAPEATPLGEVYQFRVTSDRHDLYQLRSEMQWNIVRVLRQVPGVADIVPFGGYLKEIHVEADPARLFALGLTLGDLEQAIAKSNLNVGGGFLRHGDQELTVRGIGFLESAEDIKRILLKSKDGTAVTLGDVSNVVQSFTPRRGTVGVGLEKEGIEGFVWMRRGQNPSLVLDGVHDKVRELNETILPKGMRIEIYYDRSDLVGLTLSTVHKNLLSGFVLVVGVVWLFLRSVVGSAAVAVVIPLSLLVAFLGLYALGLPANLISMGAIDFGILVDGAVVLVENVIHALRQDRPTDRRDVLRLVVRVRNADHHRRVGAGIYAAIGRGTHFPASGAHLLLCPDRCFGVRPHLGTGPVRGPVPTAARQARGAALGRTAARALSAILVMAARAQGEGSRRGICPAGAGGVDAHASRHRVSARVG